MEWRKLKKGWQNGQAEESADVRDIFMSTPASLHIGKTMEKKLRSVGIHSAEELIAVGSKQAALRLKAQYPSTCVVILYYLEAAIQGVAIKQLDIACKAELKEFFKQLY